MEIFAILTLLFFFNDQRAQLSQADYHKRTGKANRYTECSLDDVSKIFKSKVVFVLPDEVGSDNCCNGAEKDIKCEFVVPFSQTNELMI